MIGKVGAWGEGEYTVKQVSDIFFKLMLKTVAITYFSMKTFSSLLTVLVPTYILLNGMSGFIFQLQT